MRPALVDETASAGEEESPEQPDVAPASTSLTIPSGRRPDEPGPVFSAFDDGEGFAEVPMKIVAGRYALFSEIAHGGFASVHLGRTIGAAGFTRVVAIKRLHRQFVKDPEVRAMFLDEAKIVARIRHPHVLPTLDLIEEADDELFLVMDYVEGPTLRELQQQVIEGKARLPVPIVLRIMASALRGLHAAHEAKSELGRSLELVHRDVSPENILVGGDGQPRLLDFGVARALGRYHLTWNGEVKGKLQYITPEAVRGAKLDRRADIFSASVVLWECLAGRALFPRPNILAITRALLHERIRPPHEVSDCPAPLSEVVMRGLAREPEQRWPTAAAMADALEDVGALADQREVMEFVATHAAVTLQHQRRRVAVVEAADLSRRPAFSSSTRRRRPSMRSESATAVTDRYSAQDFVEDRVSEPTLRDGEMVPSSHPPARVEQPSRHGLLFVTLGAALVAAVAFSVLLAFRAPPSAEVAAPPPKPALTPSASAQVADPSSVPSASVPTPGSGAPVARPRPAPAPGTKETARTPQKPPSPPPSRSRSGRD
ncbi:MAG: protein kinase [Myxococcota bacterium]